MWIDSEMHGSWLARRQVLDYSVSTVLVNACLSFKWAKELGGGLSPPRQFFVSAPKCRDLVLKA